MPMTANRAQKIGLFTKHVLRCAVTCVAAAELAVADAGESVWTPLGLSGGGAMFGPAISPADPQRMLVHCDMSGAYRSADGGHSWTLISADQLQGNTRCKPAFHPTNPDLVFSPNAWGGKLKVSRDGGTTWSFLGKLPGAPHGEIAIDPDEPSRMLVGADETAALSRDGGQSWTPCAGVRGAVVGFAFDRASPKARRVLFTATRNGVFRSDDAGATWSEKNDGLPWCELRSFCGGAKGDAMMLYCTVPCKVVNGALAGGIFVSADRGEHWKSAMGRGLNLDTQAFDQWAMGHCVQYHQVLTTDANPQRVYAFNANTAVAVPHHTAVYRSDDGGAKWRATFFPDPDTYTWPYYHTKCNFLTIKAGYFHSKQAELDDLLDKSAMAIASSRPMAARTGSTATMRFGKRQAPRRRKKRAM
ncbi:MAG: hypothetical protein NTY53_22995 [Kiritimatiellaeota bacterium]|nr:hypothetical protein [Kiritimatiellota bacterium]